MKALPLWQPWASLVAVGAKRVETRHWPAPASLIGQRIAIHACKTKDHVSIVQEEPFQRRLREARDAGRLVFVDGELPLGAIVATAVLTTCTAMYPDAIAKLKANQPDEYAFGLYETGRFAWVFRDVEHLAQPVPWKGSQGIFDVPDDLVGYVPPPPAQETLDV